MTATLIYTLVLALVFIGKKLFVPLKNASSVSKKKKNVHAHLSLNILKRRSLNVLNK